MGALNWDVLMRWILMLTIAEYARHRGRTALLRERLDGTDGD